MLTFEEVADNYRFVYADSCVVLNPIPAVGFTSVTNGILFEGTRAECEAEYERLGLEPLEVTEP